MKWNQLMLLGAGLFGAAVVGSADAAMRAAISGRGGDSGKCTIEVVVDDAADVEVRQDVGRIHTLSGQRARWVRFGVQSADAAATRGIPISGNRWARPGGTGAGSPFQPRRRR